MCVYRKELEDWRKNRTNKWRRRQKRQDLALYDRYSHQSETIKRAVEEYRVGKCGRARARGEGYNLILWKRLGGHVMLERERKKDRETTSKFVS